MATPDIIQQLVERFNDQRADYHSGKYNETQLRLDYLNPFFEALGWDVANRKGYAERYREVLLEPSVEVAGQAKAADYAFRVGDKTLFFVEAKKPAVNIGANPEPAFQVRRYGWSAKLSLSILSDFEQLAVYDCRAKPKHGDPASDDRVQLYSFHDYLEKWGEISAIFSREAVMKGSFDKFAEGMKGKKGTADVDDAFLEEMERWREELAHNIALRNPSLSQRELNSAVQTTIDRMIFLRICEEHGIEAQDALRNATQGKNVYESLVELFKQADKKYNSGLFHFSEEKKQSSYPDTLTLALKIDDKVLKDILAHLYYPLSPYAFKYIPTAILGQVYERFLGKVIRLTPGHMAKVEEKPEVRKAGGVYYTPTYIVTYIVKHTLGELLKEQTPESQKNKPLRVLDPACGSGSFLLGAYQYLLDWYLDWYVQNEPARWARGKSPALVENQGGWQLTMDKKKEILLSHIYGVDIDAQAVEVTKLSLLLKVVENPGQLSWLNERILPDLGENIQCGNSLIGPDYYEGRQMPMFGDEELYRVNPFVWQKTFPQVFATGGFDVVIGNPPYLFITELSKPDKFYFFNKYSTSEYRFDVYGLFIELSITKLLKRSGLLSFIIPHTLLSNDSFEKLRKLLLTETFVMQVLDIGPNVFEGARNETMIFVVCKGTPKSGTAVILTTSRSFPKPTKEFSVEQSHWLNGNKSAWLVKVAEDDFLVVEKIDNCKLRLGELCTINQGLRTGDNEKYISDVGYDEIWKPVVGGKNVGRYEPLLKELYVLYDPAKLDAPRHREIFESLEKLVIQEIRNITLAKRLIATYDSQQFYCLQSTNVINMREHKSQNLSLLFLLGILNSSAANYYFRYRFSGNNHIASNQLAQIPIPLADAARHTRMVALVEGMLALHKQAAAARLPQEKEMIQRQIQATDGQIDRLVYELYGLTEEEIKIVEGG